MFCANIEILTQPTVSVSHVEGSVGLSKGQDPVPVCVKGLEAVSDLVLDGMLVRVGLMLVVVVVAVVAVVVRLPEEKRRLTSAC